jgi:hypothetical protein
MAKTLSMVNTSRSQHRMDDNDDEEGAYQRGSRVHAWNQSTTSWGNFPGLKSLGHVTPLCNDGSDDENDGEDMFSIFAWSLVVAKDQFSKDHHDRATNSSMEEEPRTYSVDIVDRSAKTSADSAEVNGGHRRSRRRASMGGSRPYSKSPGDITRRERFHRSRSKDSQCSSGSLSGDDEPRKHRKSRSSRKEIHSSSKPHNEDEEARILCKSRSSRKSSHSTSCPVPDVALLVDEPPRVHRRAQRHASMPMMTSPDTSYDEPEPQAKSRHALVDPETPVCRSVRSKRRESLSSSMPRSNEFPKPRPVDMRLFPQALPFMEGLTPKAPETPSRSSRMLRRSSMPTSMSYTDIVPNPRPLDTRLLSPNLAFDAPKNVKCADSERCVSRARSSRSKSRGCMPSTIMSSDEIQVTPGGGRERLEGTRKTRRKSNDDCDDNVVMAESSRSRRRGSPTNDEIPSSPSDLEPRTPLRRSGRVNRRSTMQ